MATTDPLTFSNDELRALLSDAAVSCDSIRREMVHAGAEPLESEPLERMRRFLGGEAELGAADVVAFPSRLRELVFDEVLARKSPGLAAELTKSTDKAVAKEAKRVLHALKARGVAFEAPRPTTAPTPVATAPAEEPQAFMTNVDGWGERILLFTRPSRGGVDVVQLVLGDREGISEARLSTLARRELRRFIGLLSSARNVLLGEMPRAYVRGLVSKGLDLNVAARRAMPTGWNDVAFALGPATPALPSPGRSLPVPDDLEAAAGRAAALLEMPEFESWGNLGEPWSPEVRLLVAERLFDNAWLLHGAERTEQASWAVAAAIWLDSDRPLEALPFAVALDARHVEA